MSYTSRLNLGNQAQSELHPNLPRVFTQDILRKNRRMNRENDLMSNLRQKKLMRAERGLGSQEYVDLQGGNKKDNLKKEYMITANEERVFNNFRNYFRTG